MRPIDAETTLLLFVFGGMAAAVITIEIWSAALRQLYGAFRRYRYRKSLERRGLRVPARWRCNRLLAFGWRWLLRPVFYFVHEVFKFVFAHFR